MKHTLFLMAVFITAFWGCAAQPSLQQLELKDYAYGQDPLQKMDVYLTADRTPETPLLILVHGGGWMAGDKADFDFLKNSLYPLGINVINLNYRLATHQGNGIHYQAIMNDLSLALDLVEKQAATWHIRPDKWIMWGNSAGGHLTLSYAYNVDAKQRISAAISFAGPVKLDDDSTMRGAKPEDVRGLLPLITGKPYVSGLLDSAYREASPYYGKRLIPTLLIHGDRDDIVPIVQSTIMHEQLIRKNIPTDFIILENGDHGGAGATEISQKLFRDRSIEWINHYSK